MDISPEQIYIVVAGLAGAIAWQNRQAAANHKRCEDRSLLLESRVDAMGKEYNSMASVVIRENTASNYAVVDYLRKLRDAVNDDGIMPDSESSLLPAIKDGYSMHVAGLADDGTTVIIRRKVNHGSA